MITSITLCLRFFPSFNNRLFFESGVFLFLSGTAVSRLGSPIRPVKTSWDNSEVILRGSKHILMIPCRYRAGISASENFDVVFRRFHFGKTDPMIFVALRHHVNESILLELATFSLLGSNMTCWNGAALDFDTVTWVGSISGSGVIMEQESNYFTSTRGKTFH